jgi:pimeloyl-ACP methyl ester carboxylesterase
VKRFAAQVPEPAASAMRAEDGTVAATRAQLAELEHSMDDLRRLRDEPFDLPDVPVVVISGTRTGGFLERGRRDELVRAHEATAAALPRGRHVRANGSSHYVPLSEPQLVADEIRAILSPSP